MNNYIISVSANYNAHENLELVQRLLQSEFDDVEFSSCIETVPFGVGYKSNFINMVVSLFSELSLDEINFKCKSIETDFGRTDELKNQKIVPIDLDVIIIGGKVIRDDYYRFPFIKQLIQDLSISKSFENL